MPLLQDVISLWCPQNVSLKFHLKIPHRSFIIACQICPYLGVSKKHAVFVCVPLNANELLLPARFPKEGGALTAHASVGQQQQSWRISRSQNEDCQ